jgi:cell division protein FtsL
MRKSTLIWLMLTIFAGALLFYTTQQVTDGRQSLAQLQKNIQEEEETLRVLQAEWSYLNQPDRLEKLSQQYLNLQPAKPRQFVDLDAIDKEAVAGVKSGEEKEETKKEEKPEIEAVTEIKKPLPVVTAEPKPVPKSVAAAPVKKQPVKAPVTAYKKPAAKDPPKTAKKPAAPAAPALKQADGRDLNDVMKSLGVR